MSKGRFEIVRTNAGHHVRLIASNGEPLSTSEVLSSEAVARDNIDAQVEAMEDATGPGNARARWGVLVVDERGDDA
jgi:uncharacterized protein YegP (UPF0339 family)